MIAWEQGRNLSGAVRDAERNLELMLAKLHPAVDSTGFDKRLPVPSHPKLTDRNRHLWRSDDILIPRLELSMSCYLNKIVIQTSDGSTCRYANMQGESKMSSGGAYTPVSRRIRATYLFSQTLLSDTRHECASNCNCSVQQRSVGRADIHLLDDR